MKNIEMFPEHSCPRASQKKQIPSPAPITRKHLKALRTSLNIVFSAAQSFGLELDTVEERLRKRQQRQKQIRQQKKLAEGGQPSTSQMSKNMNKENTNDK